MNEQTNRRPVRNAIAGVALTIAAFVVLWVAGRALLVFFAGILLAVLLSAAVDGVRRWISLSRGAALILVILALVGILSLGILVAAPPVAEQIDRLAEQLPRSVEQIRHNLEQYGWGRWLVSQLQGAFPDGGQAVSHATGFLSSLFDFAGYALFFLVVGLYFANEPDLYIRGFVRLLPEGKRERTRETLHAMGHALRWWLLGRAVSMSIIGIFTTVGLWVIGVPLALILGITAALLTFVPNIGPVVSAIPAILVASLQGMMQAAYVLLLYVGLQTVESYLVTPLVQRRAAELPPGVTVTSQLSMWVVAGNLGLALATPLAAVTMVAVTKLYLEERDGSPGRH